MIEVWDGEWTPEITFRSPETRFRTPETSFRIPETGFRIPETGFRTPETSFSVAILAQETISGQAAQVHLVDPPERYRFRTASW